MTDFVIDPSTNDYAYANGRLLVVDNYLDLTKQRLRNIFNTFKGTLFTNTDQGLDPYFLQTKDVPLTDFAQHLKTLIINTTGVISIESFNYSLDYRTRVITVEYTVNTIDGVIEDVINY